MNGLGIIEVLATYMSPIKMKTGSVTAIIASVFVYLFGGWNVGLETLILCMVADYISGLAVAVKGESNKTQSGKLSSKAGWEGLLKKGVTLLVVLIAFRLDLTAQMLGLDLPVTIRDVVLGFYIGIEFLSLLENLMKLGGKTPKILIQFLNKFIENAGGEDNEDINKRNQPDQEL